MAGDIVSVKDLEVWFPVRRGFVESLVSEEQRYVKAVDGITFSIKEREIFCLVGESGCGKTTTGKAILRLVEPTGGDVAYYGPGKNELLKEMVDSAQSKRKKAAARVYMETPEEWSDLVEIADLVDVNKVRATLGKAKLDEILKRANILTDRDDIDIAKIQNPADRKALRSCVVGKINIDRARTALGKGKVDDILKRASVETEKDETEISKIKESADRKMLKPYIVQKISISRARDALGRKETDEILKRAKVGKDEHELDFSKVKNAADKKLLKPFATKVKTNWITMSKVPKNRKEEVLKAGGINVRTLSKHNMKAMRQKLQIIFQDPYESLNPKQSIYDIIAEPLVVNGIGVNEADREARVVKALEDSGLRPPKNYMWRYPHEVSGGQRQRVGVAGALVLDPNFLVADEPVSMLDVSIRSEILKLMLDLREKKGLSFLFITHDLGVAYVFSDRIGIMYLGKIVELGPTEKVIKNPQHPYTKALISVVPTPDPKDRTEKIILKGERPDPSSIPPGCRFHPRCPFMMDICKKAPPEPVFVSEGHWVSCHLQQTKGASTPAKVDEGTGGEI
ncbi:MAG TPA: oligopeptide/dipeptide ABC transporter ATP-binding protein [Thermoplasmata archaeon]|nr:oligopeptide/dipeptide ABC transporter ATP-binding protein [Thermoplasmata archaeon]